MRSKNGTSSRVEGEGNWLDEYFGGVAGAGVFVLEMNSVSSSVSSSSNSRGWDSIFSACSGPLFP